MSGRKHITVDYLRGEVVLPELLAGLPAVRYQPPPAFSDPNLRKRERLQKQFPGIRCRLSPAFQLWLAANLPVLKGRVKAGEGPDPGCAAKERGSALAVRAAGEEPSALDSGEGLTKGMEPYFQAHPELGSKFSLDDALERLRFVLAFLRGRGSRAPWPSWVWAALCARREAVLDSRIVLPLPQYAFGLLFPHGRDSAVPVTHAEACAALGGFIRETASRLRRELPPGLDFLTQPDPAVRGAEEKGISLLFSASGELSPHGYKEGKEGEAVAVAAFLALCRGLPDRLKPGAWQVLAWEKRDLPPPAARAFFLRERKSSAVSVLGWGDAVMGIGEDQRTLTRALESAGVRCATVLASRYAAHGCEPFAWAVRKRSRPDGLFAIVCLAAQDIYRLWAAAPEAWWAGRHVIGLCPWELPLWPASARYCLAMLNEIWAPSAFAARAFAGCGRPVFHLPHAIVPPRPGGDLRAELGIGKDESVFLTAFDMGASALRKNPQAVLRAFQAAFAGSGLPARLIVKTLRTGWNQACWRQLREENKSGRAVLFIDEIMSPERSAALLNSCDAFVSLHRSEGFGRLLAEAMSLGKLLIASDFGGNTDFTTPETACPISGRLAELKPGEYLFGEGQHWFEADIEHAAQTMREFALAPERFAARMEKGRRHILTRHSLETVGRLAKEALLRVGATLTPA